MANQQLIDFLDEHQINYLSITHPLAYTAQEIAASAHVPGSEITKTVMVKLDGNMVMVVIPANRRLDLELLRQATGAESATLATESEFRRLFKDCELGAMPPFGNLWGISVITDEELAHEKRISFNAGSHLELIKIAYSDFDQWVHPTVLHVTQS